MAEAFAAYSRLATMGGAWAPRHGIAFEEKLYLRERVRFEPAGRDAWLDTGYLLAVDPQREAHRDVLRCSSMASMMRARWRAVRASRCSSASSLKRMAPAGGSER